MLFWTNVFEVKIIFETAYNAILQINGSIVVLGNYFCSGVLYNQYSEIATQKLSFWHQHELIQIENSIKFYHFCRNRRFKCSLLASFF